MASWVRWLLAVGMLAVAAYHVMRLARARHRDRVDLDGIDVDIAHAAMGTTMAAMLIGLPGVPLLPALFGGAACWFLVRTVRGFVLIGGSALAPPAQAGVGCSAMVVMLAGSIGPAAHPMSGMAMPTEGDYRSAAIALVVATVAMAGWTVERWRREYRSRRPRALALGCQLAMNVTTVAMLALR